MKAAETLARAAELLEAYAQTDEMIDVAAQLRLLAADPDPLDETEPVPVQDQLRAG